MDWDFEPHCFTSVPGHFSCSGDYQGVSERLVPTSLQPSRSCTHSQSKFSHVLYLATGENISDLLEQEPRWFPLYVLNDFLWTETLQSWLLPLMCGKNCMCVRIFWRRLWILRLSKYWLDYSGFLCIILLNSDKITLSYANFISPCAFVKSS